MAIRKNSNGTWDVYASYSSRVNPLIRVQRRKIGISSKLKATKVFTQLRDECIIQVERKDGKGTHWGDLVERWFLYESSIQRLGADTLEDYYKSLLNWTSHLLKEPAREITKSDVKKILFKVTSEGKSKSFQAKLKQTINKVYEWGFENDLVYGIDKSPAFGIKINRRKEERKPEILTKSEIQKLLSEARINNSPWYPVWYIAIQTGCRSGELYALTWDDIDFENDRMIISKSFNKRHRETKCTKSGKYRTIHLNRVLKSFLLSLKESSKGPHVLPRIRSWDHGYQARELRNFCTLIGITPIKFHALRACFATQLLQNGVPPINVMKVGGWKDMDTMAIYVRMAGVDEAGSTECLNAFPDIALSHQEKSTQLLPDATLNL